MPEKLWTKNYTLALAVAFLISMVFYMLMTTMVLYATEEFGAGDVLAGLASSIFVIGAVAARLVAGPATDRLGRRRVLLVALVLGTIAALAYFPADGLVALLVVRLVHGIAFGAAHTAASAIVQTLIPPARRAEGTGYHGATTTLGTAVGPLVAVLLTADSGYDAVFVVTATVSVIALGAGVWLRAPKSSTPVPVVGGRRRLVEAAAVPIASFIFICATAFSGVVAFVSAYATDLGLTTAAAVFFLVYAVVVIVTRPFLGRLQDARGDNIVIYPAILCFAAGLGTLAVTQTSAVLLIAAGLLGLGWGSLMSAGQAVAVRRAPIVSVGLTISTYFLLVDLGMGFGPIVLGVVVGQLDYRWMYATLAVVMLASCLYYRAVHGKRLGHADQVPAAVPAANPAVGAPTSRE
ncbi:MFS transporter [Georgenia sunbinii]|uniref:MFS transporter n=1 Tax=Georgenia sunbinii TaxID=3117728 RepID=UPI002F26D551